MEEGRALNVKKDNPLSSAIISSNFLDALAAALSENTGTSLTCQGVQLYDTTSGNVLTKLGLHSNVQRVRHRPTARANREVN